MTNEDCICSERGHCIDDHGKDALTAKNERIRELETKMERLFGECVLCGGKTYPSYNQACGSCVESHNKDGINRLDKKCDDWQDDYIILQRKLDKAMKGLKRIKVPALGGKLQQQIASDTILNIEEA